MDHWDPRTREIKLLRTIQAQRAAQLTHNPASKLTGGPESPGFPGFPVVPGTPGDPGGPCKENEKGKKNIDEWEGGQR